MPLPPGLFLNRTTGVISGTPTQAGTFSGTLRVRDAQNQSRDMPYSIVIDPYTAPSLSGSLDQYAMRTQAYSGQLTISDGTAPFVWSIASGTLPTGITLDTGTGAISGTPTDTTYTARALTIRAVDAMGSVAQYGFTLKYTNALAFPDTYPDANIGTNYDHTPVTVGGHAPLSYAITSGSLPAGLALDAASGRVFGTPTVQATYTATIACTDAAGNISAQAVGITVNPAYTAISVTGSVTGNSTTVQKASGSSTFSPNYSGVTVANGTGSYSYSWARTSGSTAISPAAPSSLTTGFVGTVAPGNSLSTVFRCTITDGVTTATLDVTITITNSYVVPSLGGSIDDEAMYGEAYSSGFTVTGGKAPYTWARTSGTLPTGLTLNASTGVISGTPTDTGYTNRPLTIRVTDAEGQTASASFTLQYFASLTLSGSPGAAYKGAAYSYTPARVGGFSPFTYSITAGTLPAGLSLNASTGAITGTPTTPTGGAAVTIRVADSDGHSYEHPVTFVVNNYTLIDITGAVSGQSTTVDSYAGTKTISPNYGSLSVSGGSGTITYSWARQSGSTAISANSPTALATTFAATAAPGTTVSAVFRVTATDGISSDTFDVTVQLQNLYVEPSLSGTLTARATRTVPYSSGLSVSGGVAPYTWAVVSGTLPTGMTINASTGVISGTPTDTSYTTRSITVSVTDSSGRSKTSAQSITYRNAPDMVAATLAYGWRNSAYGGSVVASNAASTHALTYSLQSGTLPTGVTLNASTAALSGTPTSTSYGSLSLTFRATDVDGNYDDAIFTLPYADELAASESTPNGSPGVAYSGSVSRTGGHSPFSYSVLSGALPAGVTLNATTGILSGTPSVSGTFSGTFRVTDAGGKTADVAWTFDVAATVSIQSRTVTRTTSLDPTVGWRLNSAGTVSTREGGSYTTRETWLLSGAASDYEVQCSYSGTSPSGSAVGSWLSADSNPEWYIVDPLDFVPTESTLTVRLRLKSGDGTILSTATISLYSERN